MTTVIEKKKQPKILVISTPSGHPCPDYIRRRNELIPQAEEWANEQAGPRPEEYTDEYPAWANRWNKLFHGRMNELARGL